MHNNIEIIHPQTHPRSSGVAFIFSLLFPGLGQIYNGQLLKGLLLIISIWVIPFLFRVTGAILTYNGFMSLMVVLGCLWIYGWTDAIWQAKRNKNFVAKPYNTWYVYLLLITTMSTALYFVNPTDGLGIKSFEIPTTSNNPTLLVGDLVVADRNAYHNTDPDYGDIVVFSKADGQLYVFRVIGKPGDTIEVNTNKVTINGKPNAQVQVSKTTNEGRPVLELEETLPNGHKHKVLHYELLEDGPRIMHTTVVLPADSFFVLGDNRDNAFDSRYDGLVGKDQIKGRIRYSYWNTFEKGRHNIDYTRH